MLPPVVSLLSDSDQSIGSKLDFTVRLSMKMSTRILFCALWYVVLMFGWELPSWLPMAGLTAALLMNWLGGFIPWGKMRAIREKSLCKEWLEG